MKKILLVLILLLGLSVRTVNLANFPPGLAWDEAALGYNAYSILKTGRDEFGKFLPIVFKSFGDYKPGFYIYLTVPAIAIFGLNEFAVRLPSAVMGTLAILFVYLLVNLITKNKNLSLLAALTLALSPWHIHFSRSAWEVNVFSTLFLISIYCYYKSLGSKFPVWPTFLFILLSLFTYQAAKLLIPLVFISLLCFNFRLSLTRLQSALKTKDLIPMLILVLLSAWVYFGALFTSAGNRLAVQNLFGFRPGISAEQRHIDDNNQLSLNLFHNQFELTSRLIISRYLYHFSPEVLFYEGPVVILRGRLPRLGMLYLFDAVWLVLGLVYLIVKADKKFSRLVFALLLLAPIPASLTLGEFSTIRGMFMAIPLAIIIACGIYYSFKHLPKFLSLAFLVAWLFNITLGYDYYFLHSSEKIAEEFNYGMRQAVEKIKTYPARKVVFTDVFGQPYIYYLFYSQYDPATYQKMNDFVEGGIDVGHVGRIDNIEFHQFNAAEVLNTPDALFIGSEGNINNDFNHNNPLVEYFGKIDSPDNKPVFRVVKTKKI